MAERSAILAVSTSARPNLTFVQATSLMVGAGVGAGIMAVPFLAIQTGIGELAIIVLIAFGANCVIHLMLAEVIFRTGRDLQVIELMGLHLLTGRLRPLVWVAFALLGLAFIAILAAYIAGGSEIVRSLSGAPTIVSDLAVYAVFAGIVLLGLRGVGISEVFGAAVLVGAVLLLVLGSVGVPMEVVWGPRGGPAEALAVYAMVMYALFTFYTVPQVVKGLAPHRSRAVGAIVAGLAVNAVLVLVVAIVAIGVSQPVTEVAVVGMSERLGGWAGTIGSLFIFAALMTSYWSVSLALADVIGERTGIGARVSWLLATAPSLLVLLLGGWRFLEWLRLAGGATALVVVLVSVPMYVVARRHHPATPWSLGALGSWPVLVGVVVAAGLMALGSLLAL